MIITQASLLAPKFDYQKISRETINGKRHYCTPDGEKLPSVTTILDSTKSEEKSQALQDWRKRVGHANAQQITTEAAGVGTVMHRMLEEHICGKSKSPGTNQVQKVAYPMAQTIIQNGLVHLSEVWGSEIPLYFPRLYAGTTDGAGVWKNKQAIFDFKQTNRPKKREWIDDYFVQLVMYASAHNEIHGTAIRTGVVLMCSRSCEYQEFVLEGPEWVKYENLMWSKLEQYYSHKSELLVDGSPE
jgi:hypothetical protein